MKTIRLFGISILSVLMSISASSCSSSSSNDDDLGKVKSTNVTMSYGIFGIHEKWFDYIDFTLEYYKGNNQLESKTLAKDFMEYYINEYTNKKTYSWECNTINEKIPAKLGIRVKMKLKKEADIDKMISLYRSVSPCNFWYSYIVRDASNSVIERVDTDDEDNIHNIIIYQDLLDRWKSDPTQIITKSFIFTFSEYSTKKDIDI
jgi:hypothetical protein